jgi:hypothetical protein
VAGKQDEPKIEWPRWATWALAGVVIGAVLTVAATVNDIF